MAGGLEKKGLGRGLSALLADIGPQDVPEPAAASTSRRYASSASSAGLL